MSAELSLPPQELTGSVYRSALIAENRLGVSGFAITAVLLHVAVIAAAFLLPKFFDHEVVLRKPVIAKLVALGKPRPKGALPKKETGGRPPVASAPVSVPSASPSSTPSRSVPAHKAAPVHKQPSRQELMRRALAQAAGQSVAAERQSEETPTEREGAVDGSEQGTSNTA